MSDYVKHWVVRLFRVPAEPHIPDGSPDSVRVFRAGEKFYQWCLLVWFLTYLGVFAVIAPLIFGLEVATARVHGFAYFALRSIQWTLILLFIASLLLSYFQLRLNYELRWYIVTDRSLRIRSGIFSVQELTLTYANIQEIRVSANPLQIFLGIADVEVHTAGGNEKGASSHIGRFQGVDNANDIRDLIVERLRIYRDSGLGDPHATDHKPSAALEAAQLVLAESKSLRQTLLRT